MLLGDFYNIALICGGYYNIIIITSTPVVSKMITASSRHWSSNASQNTGLTSTIRMYGENICKRIGASERLPCGVAMNVLFCIRAKGRSHKPLYDP